LNRKKLQESRAQFWVFVLRGFESAPDFVVIPKEELQRRMRKIPTSGRGILQIYLCSTKEKPRRCWEMRGLPRETERQIAEGTYNDDPPNTRDFTKYLNENGWAAVASRLKG